MREIFILNFVISLLFSQIPTPGKGFKKIEGKAKIKGVVKDSLTKDVLPFATVTLNRLRDSSMVTGTLTDDRGNFILKKVPPGFYFLKVDFVGFKQKIISPLRIGFKDTIYDLGEIFLKPAIFEAEPVEVTAEPLPIKYQIDRKVIEVAGHPTAQSGTAVDVLRNVPSVEVDIEGKVKLRGSENFQVYINGRPTTLEPEIILNQIPATSIDKIEIMTNPSAKYDPEGVTGIMNIILKKKTFEGLSGIFNLTAGMYGNYGGDLILRLRREKYNFYLGLNYTRRGFESVLNSIRSFTTTTLNSQGNFKRGFIPKGIRTGFDFYLNKRNSFGFSLNYGEWEMEGSAELFYQEKSDTGGVYNYKTKDLFERKGPYFELNLYDIFNFDEKNKNISFDFTYSRRGGKEKTETIKEDLNSKILEGSRITEEGPRELYNFKSDLSLPFNKLFTFESGFQIRLDKNQDITNYFYYDTTKGNFVGDERFYHDVIYKKNIYSLYSLLKGQTERWGYQVGIRAELTDRNISYRDTSLEFSLYRWDFFPTFHFSVKLDNFREIMGGYTRRIWRPRDWWLEPFITWLDAYNVRKGNPDLKPQYIDNFEISFSNPFKKGNLVIDFYYRLVHNEVERVNKLYSENVILHTYENIGKSYAYGTEISLNLNPLRIWNINLTYDMFNYRLKGSFDGEDLSRSSFNYNIRLNTSIFLSRSIRFALSGRYHSPRVTAQGDRKSFYTFDIAIQKFFMNRKLIFNIQVRDVFNTEKREFNSNTSYYSYNQIFDPSSPVLIVTLTYNYNNYKFKEKKRGEESEMPEMEFEF